MVAEPIVAFRNSADQDIQDRWSQTYASGKSSPSPTRPSSMVGHDTGATAPLARSQTRSFPRPISSSSTRQTNVGSRVTDYISSTTSRSRSPLKPHVTGPNPEAGILPSLTPNDNTLSKVYGSVLQPKETLKTFSCAVCSSAFPPDATIYPDPQQPNSSHRFLCRPCFVENGGSKGPCDACGRPVLTLKTEGGFIHAADKYWHKRCFNCAGCSDNIGDSPMVDLLGQPCCPGCFDNCLKRDATPKKQRASVDTSRVDTTPLSAGANKPQTSKSHESSPVIGELEYRLGVKRRESGPALDDLAQRLSFIGKEINSRQSAASPTVSPTVNRSREPRRAEATPSRSKSSSPTKDGEKHRLSSGSPTPEALQEMKQRLVKSTSTPPPRTGQVASKPRDILRKSHSIASDDHSSPRIPPTPDLVSDFSDTMTQSSLSGLSGFDSPPRASADDIFGPSKTGGKDRTSQYSRHERYTCIEDPIYEETHSQLNTPTKPSTQALNRSARKSDGHPSPAAAESSPLRRSTTSMHSETTAACARCDGKLFGMGSGGTFITVPSDNQGPPTRYHVRCFTCQVCDGIFEQGSSGQATFVKHAGRACHPEVSSRANSTDLVTKRHYAQCAPKERIFAHKSPSQPALRTRAATVSAARPSPSPGPPSKPVISSRFEQAALVTSPTAQDTAPTPRFGGPRNACPGCKKAVSPMERGVIPGPHGTKWHSSCLVCGGKKTRPVSWYARDDAEKSKPGCGKRLDSAAKSDSDGGVWCRECIVSSLYC